MIYSDRMSMIPLFLLKALRAGLMLAGCFGAFTAVVPAEAGDVPARAARVIAVDDPATPQSNGPVLRPDDPTNEPRPTLPPALNTSPLTPARPALQSQSIDELFQSLRTAKTVDEARPIDAMIQARFMRSGSATADLLMERALLAVHGENLPLALDLLDSVIALKPDFAEAWNKRATLYFLTHDYGKAISDVEMVLRIEPRQYQALIGLAAMLNELGDKKRALTALERVLALYPSNTDVAKEVEDLRTTLSGRAL